jgi:hypothetical protein
VLSLQGADYLNEWEKQTQHGEATEKNGHHEKKPKELKRPGLSAAGKIQSRFPSLLEQFGNL